MEEAFSLPKLLMAGCEAGAAVYAGDVPFVFSRGHVHKADPVAAFAVGAFIGPRGIHLQPEGDRAYPAEEHLHKAGGADEFAEVMPDKNGCGQHIKRDADNTGLYPWGEIPRKELVPYGPGRDKISGEGYAAQDRQYHGACESQPAVGKPDGSFRCFSRVVRPFSINASSAQEL